MANSRQSTTVPDSFYRFFMEVHLDQRASGSEPRDWIGAALSKLSRLEQLELQRFLVDLLSSEDYASRVGRIFGEPSDVAAESDFRDFLAMTRDAIALG